MPFSHQSSNLLYHQYLKGDDQPLNEMSSLSDITSSQSSSPFPYHPAFHWDLQSTSKSMFPALHYISEKLVKEGLQIALIISDHSPCVIPVWQLPRQTQILLTRIIRKACAKYNLSPSWMTALASLEGRNDISKVLEEYKPDAYIIRRSLLQNEVIFSSEGLTLLSIDHIFTLKQLLCTLSKDKWVSYSRSVCVSSCVHLLHRINKIHNGTKFTKGYIARAYKEVPFQVSAFDEITAEQDTTFSTANIHDIASSLPDFHVPYPSLADPEDDPTELPTRSTSPNDLVSPLADLDLRTLYSWASDPAPTPSEPAFIRSIPMVTYPRIHQPSPSPILAQEAEIWHRSLPSSPVSTTDSWGPDAPPSPLRVVKRASTKPSSTQQEEAHEVGESDQQHWPSLEMFKEEERELQREEQEWAMELLRKEEREVQREEEEWAMELLREERRAKDVEMWNRTVPEVVCAKCFDAIEAPRRYTLCY